MKRNSVLGSYLRAVFSSSLVAPADQPIHAAMDRLNAVSEHIISSSQPAASAVRERALDDLARNR